MFDDVAVAKLVVVVAAKLAVVVVVEQIVVVAVVVVEQIVVVVVEQIAVAVGNQYPSIRTFADSCSATRSTGVRSPLVTDVSGGSHLPPLMLSIVLLPRSAHHRAFRRLHPQSH